MTDITIANSNTKLAASVYGPSAAAPILFLHGISLSRDTWEEIAQRLSPTYCIWALDFRGHGHSDRSSRYELVDYVSDAEAALATIGRPAIVEVFRGVSTVSAECSARVRREGEGCLCASLARASNCAAVELAPTKDLGRVA
jgi:pimeloyl-ACP methyl ester carboxylesterase